MWEGSRQKNAARKCGDNPSIVSEHAKHVTEKMRNEGVRHSAVAPQDRSFSLLRMACPLVRLQERCFHEYGDGPFSLSRSTCSEAELLALWSEIFFFSEPFELVFHCFR